MLSFDQSKNQFLVNNTSIELTDSDIQEMNSYQWWQQIPFSPQVKPKGTCNPVHFISHYLLDTIDFKGKSVLDIGCWDGFQLFYAEARGASRVVGVDKIDQRYMGTSARDFAKRKLQSNVEFYDMNIYDLSPQNIGTFDIVMTFGVLYHLIHPMLGIEKACSVAKQEFLISTHFVPSSDPYPWCILYPDDELSEDHSNWSGANKAWILKALEIQGFVAKREHVYHDDRITIYATREKTRYINDPMLNSHRDTTLLK